MQAAADLIPVLIAACHEVMIANVDHLCELDAAIGDGDHGANMQRGSAALVDAVDRLAGMPLPEALETIGEILVMHIGGASGPLYGTLFLETGRSMRLNAGAMDLTTAFGLAVDAVARRGRASAGDKTLLDVLHPVHRAIIRGETLKSLAKIACYSANLTIDMKAMRGRAAFLGDRSIGHLDPGAQSCALLISQICHTIQELEPA